MDDIDAGLYGPVEPAQKTGRWDRFKAAFTTKHAASVTKYNTGHNTTAYASGDVSLSRLVDYFERDIYFSLAVRLNADAVTGQGYSLSGMDSIKGRQALEIIEDWADTYDLDAILQRIAIDGWISGNWFGEWRDGMIKHIAQNCITQIMTNEYGEPDYYQVQRRGRLDKMYPDDILHFRFQVSGGSGGEAYGVGLGQIMARRGAGYKQSNGRMAHRPSQFEINEIKDNLILQTLQAGIPRYLVNVGKSSKDVVESVTRKMQNMDLLQHYVSNADLDVKEMALSPSNKMGDIFRSIESSTAIASMSPVSRLWQDLGFTSYASSQSAMESMLPQIKSFQRALKRFVENSIFNPILEANKLDPKKHRVSISFGTEDGLDLEDIADLMVILREDEFKGRWSPDDVLELIRDAGVGLGYMTPDMQTQSNKHMARQKKRLHTVYHNTRHAGSDPDKVRRVLRRRYNR